MDAPAGHDQNADQIAYWNGAGGQRWADRQPVQDILLQPVADLVIDRARIRAGERVLDVGCGSGSTSFAFARAVGPSGHVMGIDISAPMLARAREGTPPGAPAGFVRAGEFRSARLAVRRDVLCRSRTVLCQYAACDAPIGPARLCLLA